MTDPDPPTSGAGAGPPEPGPVREIRCDLCGGRMLDRHCKLVCLTCGFQRDCSDP